MKNRKILQNGSIDLPISFVDVQAFSCRASQNNSSLKWYAPNEKNSSSKFALPIYIFFRVLILTSSSSGTAAKHDSSYFWVFSLLFPTFRHHVDCIPKFCVTFFGGKYQMSPSLDLLALKSTLNIGHRVTRMMKIIWLSSSKKYLNCIRYENLYEIHTMLQKYGALFRFPTFSCTWYKFAQIFVVDPDSIWS